MAKYRRCKPGDLFLIRLNDIGIVVELILHTSRLFRDGIIAGFFDCVFDSESAIDESQLVTLIAPPNYTAGKMIRDGYWPFYAHRPEMLMRIQRPLLRVVGAVYDGDQEVMMLPIERFNEYPEALFGGAGAVEKKLTQLVQSRKQGHQALEYPDV
ncbi:MAG: hypothetical protein Fur005_48730 [Roseiflexaceae bacterium]